jgi:hypothetical protein
MSTLTSSVKTVSNSLNISVQANFLSPSSKTTLVASMLHSLIHAMYAGHWNQYEFINVTVSDALYKSYNFLISTAL